MADSHSETTPIYGLPLPPEADRPTPLGRPNKWTASRERKLIHLYLYSTLAPQDIAKALREQDEWQPGKESTVKEVSRLLDSQPRWLHPRTRKEMEQRIAELAQCKKQRKFIRKLFSPKASQAPTGPLPAIPIIEVDEMTEKQSLELPSVLTDGDFSQSILRDLIAATPQIALKPVFTPSPDPCPSTTSSRSTSSNCSKSIEVASYQGSVSTDSSSESEFQPVRTRCTFGGLTDRYARQSKAVDYASQTCGFLNCRDCNPKQYGFHDIARGARGITFFGHYECLICHETDSHSNSYLDQMICASRFDRNRTFLDASGMTPAQALITIPRVNDIDGGPETAKETLELFRTLFPRDDAALRTSLSTLDPAGRTLIENITIQGFVEILDYLFVDLGIIMEGDSFTSTHSRASNELDGKQSTYLSTSSLRKRLPSKYSAGDVKDIARLMKAHSLADSSAPVPYRLTSCFSLADTEPEQYRDLSLRAQDSTTLNLADAFLVLDHHIKMQGPCIPGLALHDSGRCWCHVTDGLVRIWIGKFGFTRAGTLDPPQLYSSMDLLFRDHFGNSVTHMLAARGSGIAVIVKALEQGIDGNTKNAASQTFLHVLHKRLLEELAVDPGLFDWVVQLMDIYNVDLHACDPYGRTIFHLVAEQATALRPAAFQFSKLSPKQSPPTRRDAFGLLPNFSTRVPSTVAYGNTSVLQDRQGHSAVLFGVQADANFTLGAERPRVLPVASEPTGPAQMAAQDQTDMLDYRALAWATTVEFHTCLLKTASLALDCHFLEDFDGRNGLHCLAEASLAWNIDLSQVPQGGSRKRRIGQNDVVVSRQLTFRSRLVQNMIEAGADLNHYNCAGHTVLMAFVAHLSDGEADKTLTELFQHIIHKGADIHRRNRSGETALHIAVRLGRKVATKVLLMNGANVHARDLAGNGVLVTGEKHYLKAHDNPRLYAAIMACMALCIQYGAIAAPTIRHEWSA